MIDIALILTSPSNLHMTHSSTFPIQFREQACRAPSAIDPLVVVLAQAGLEVAHAGVACGRTQRSIRRLSMRRGRRVQNARYVKQ